MTPAERAKLGCVRDIRDLEREGGVIKKKVAVVDKYNHPPGKFDENPRDNIGSARGRDVCEHCRGVCCSAMRHLVYSLVDMGELKPDLKVCLGVFL